MDLLNVFVQQTIRFSGLIGAVIALVGTLYMAYDLFGQRHGPLRVLTEALTYVIVGIVVGTLALGLIALDAVFLDPYFVNSVTVRGAISVLIAFGASGGFGAGLGYVLTIERKWHAGQPRYHPDRPLYRVLKGLLLGVFEGYLVYVVMANFRNTHDVRSGLFWGAAQGWPVGLLFGFLVAYLQVYFNQQSPTSRDEDTGKWQWPFDPVGLRSGIATGVGVGPITAMSYFALYGPVVPQTFVMISCAGLVGGVGLGLVLATAERIMLWVDRLPPKRLGIAGVFFIFLGFLFQAVQQVAQIAASYSLNVR